MGDLTLRALRAVLVMLLAGSVFVQTVMVALITIDLENAGTDLSFRVTFITIVVSGIVAAQVVLLCVWRLVTMVKRGTVFSPSAFRYVDIVIGATVAASVVVFAFAVLLAPTNVPPGIVLLVCGTAVAVLGVALVVLVMRMLLVQAVARDTEAAAMKAELDEVI